MIRLYETASPSVQSLIHGTTALLLVTTVACGGKKDEGSSSRNATDPGLEAAGGAFGDEPEEIDPDETEARGPAVPVETEEGECPEEAFIEYETGECLEGTACPLGYAEVYLSEGERPLCWKTPWMDQFGSEADDTVVALERNLNGETVVLGSTGARLDGNGAGGFDLFVRVYDSEGSVVWTRQFGSVKHDLGAGMALGTDGRIYVVGRSFDLVESEEGGDVFVEVQNEDGFVYCLSEEGETMWHREIASDMPDEATAVAVDSEENVYVTGSTNGALSVEGQLGGSDGFLVKYNELGDALSTRVLGGTWDDFVSDIALDAQGGVVLSGSTEGSIDSQEAFEGFDAFVIRFDADLEVDWTRHFGTPGEDGASTLAIADSGTIYVGGDVGGQLGDSAFGGRDFFLRSYTASGELRWTRQYGTEGQDRLHALRVGPDGLLFFAGDTMGTFEADKSGKMEGFYGVLTQSGELVDIRDFGTAEDDTVQALEVDTDGAVYLGGGVGAALVDQEHLGMMDAYVAKVAFD